MRPALVVAAQRGWQAAAGLVTSLLILHFLSAAQQGWYYSFVSLAAFFTLFDMGLSLILIQRAARLFTGMRLAARGQLQGDNVPAFGQLAAHARWWYTRAAAAFVLLLFPLGLWFFGSVRGGLAADASLPAHWGVLWTVLLAATGVNLWLLSFQSLAEGAGEVTAVYALRLAQGVAGSLFTWVLLAADAGMWACVGVPLMAALIGIAWLAWWRPGLYRAARDHAGPALDWQAALWPQQWRLALGWFSGYLLTQIYVPLLLRTDGPGPAGQFGITLTLANALALLSQSWLTHAYPELAARAAHRDWAGMRRAFKRTLRVYTGLYVAGTVAFVGILLAASSTPYVERLLPMPALLALFAAIFLNQLATAIGTGLRAAGIEPFAWVTATGAVLTLAFGLPMLLGYGVQGLVAAMVIVQAAFVLPMTAWVGRRRMESWT